MMELIGSCHGVAQHGEIQTIQQFYALDRSTRPEAKDCIFFSTHEPCSLCGSLSLSCIPVLSLT